MAIPVMMQDGRGENITPASYKFKDGYNGFVVASRPYNYYEFKRYTFNNSTYGQNMNIGSVYGPTPELVHDGIDSVLWTGSTIVGTSPTFSSTQRSYTGTNSILWDNPNEGSIFQLTKSLTFSLLNSVTITMWINIDKDYDPTDYISFYAWDTSVGSIVGQPIYLNNYMNVGNIDVWQKLTIQLIDMNLVNKTIDSFRFYNEIRNGAKSPKIFIDNIRIEELSAASGQFIVEPEPQTWFFCEEATLFLTDVYTPPTISGNIYGLNYTKWLNEPAFDSGINVLVTRFDKIRYNIIFKTLGEWIQYGGRINDFGYDGVSESWLSLSLPFYTPILLKSETYDKVTININDNLSGLTTFTGTARGYIEYKVNNDKGIKNVY